MSTIILSLQDSIEKTAVDTKPQNKTSTPIANTPIKSSSVPKIPLTRPLTTMSTDALIKNVLRSSQKLQNQILDLTTPSNRNISIFVARNCLKCYKDAHTIINIQAIVRSLNGKDVTIPIHRCLSCTPSFYFIDDEVLQIQEQKKGCLLFLRKYIDSSPSDFSDTCSIESELHRLGYNVNARNGMTAPKRQQLLVSIIHSKRLSKFDIMCHLEYLLRRNARHPNMQIARLKWQEDLDFLAYRFDSSQTYRGTLSRNRY